ncbi:acyl-CoA dehydrogenase family protein [Siccirubricoccus sp. KC 17139]|uniref:Acyl-CoA dehydrogenase family protein n=1 Tax=Siccirubricoccus soli TaxID=2899147 RepID=A0ABT1D017_9PROT|nr:acyl-CoA dehydrogenase family protein [Siccirubricoccus soli]MCO6415227.1 acyl-CoA dehydrogenase family protein [Siccirubricoccus soli]MCP2681358.1 acyl-CoA dehydrogenase family protein [Siccirubricoccus soli]
MSFALGQDQIEVRDLVRRVAQERVAARAAEIDRTAEYPQDMFDLLKELGLFTLPFPPEHGGSGSLLSAVVAIEELGRVCYNTAYLLLVQWAPLGAILAGGTPEQKARLLPGLADGSLRAAFSLTEPQSGSDVAGIRTRARRDGGDYIVNGGKIWCTNAGVSDFVLVACKVDDGDEVSFFIIEKGMPGFTVGSKEDKMGARGVPSYAIFLDNVRLPAANRLGGEGGKFKDVMEALNQSRPLIAARALGCAQGAMDHAVAFIKDRRAFGQSVADFQGVRWIVADMAIQIEAARQLVYAAAAAVDDGLRGGEMARLAASAKCFATDTAMKVATDAVQLFGAAGISNEFPINRYFRDAKVLQIIEGTNQIQRNIVARNIIGPGKR